MSEKAKKQDRRTRYTRQTIKDTFLELLKQKSFTKITVTEVCKNAEINRGAYSARTAHPFQRNGAPFRFKLSKAQQVD